ncbi:MAG: DMT family transporter [Acidobacteriota bacterium]
MRPLQHESGSSPWRADAVLLVVTIVWGSSFVVVRHALDTAPPLLLLFGRFGLGAVLIAPALARRPLMRAAIRDGLLLGALLALGMCLQISGQAGTTATKAGFLTGLASVVTPFVAVARTRRLPTAANGVGIALASAGFLLLTHPPPGAAFERGDLLVGASSVVFAVYAVELAQRAGRHDALWLTGLQLAVVAACAGASSFVLRAASSGTPAAALEARPVDWTGAFPWSVLYLGVVCTAGAFLGWTWAQGRMSAIHGAIILALEPVVAALLAAWLLRERLPARGLAGAILVLFGIVVSEVRLGQIPGELRSGKAGP